MATLPVYNLRREEVGKIEVSDEIFGATVNRHLFYEVVKWQLAKRRAGTAHTKGRAQVRGGGAKPYKQKGTGRARQGSRRAPNHVGGGTVHGPKPRSYAYALPKKMRRGAIRSALSLRAQEGRLVVVQDLNLGEVKTKKAAEIFEKLVGQYALVVEGENRELTLSVRNLPRVKYLALEGLNVFDILKYPNLVVTEAMVRRIEGALAK
ncbi:50S ribosomal protein L4 [Myxococcota bacterium]|jgi:large subunit ribosomal protein L4|nr:50S ribosomal protein L4 [Myxococcota bacterium]